MPFPKILVVPLDWGLGHASRCVPIVNELISQGCEVWMAGEGKIMSMLRGEFPRLQVLPLSGYGIYYHNTTGYLRWVIVKQIPAIIRSIRREHDWLNKIMEEQRFDAVISDNRYGLYTGKALSVFITHQLGINTGLGTSVDRWVQKINYRYINKFDECWVPDFKGNDNLAGKLSHPRLVPANTRYIGPLSRFRKTEVQKKYDLLILLSGPEPRRTIWEDALLKELQTFKGRVLLVRGLPGCHESALPGIDSEMLNFVSANELNLLVQRSEWVLCRSGYSSVMDMVRLQHKAILVPTPGQPEQEYLAQYLHQKGMFYTVREVGLNLERCLQEANHFHYRFSNPGDLTPTLKTHVTDLLQRIKNMHVVNKSKIS